MTALNLRPGFGPPRHLVDQLAHRDRADFDLEIARLYTSPLTQTMRVPVLFGVPMLARIPRRPSR